MNPLLTSVFGDLFKSAKGIIDEAVTTDEERMEREAQLRQIFNQAEMNAQQQVSDRWKYDMASDNKLSKNIRPMMLIAVASIFFIMTFTDGNVGDFQINSDYLPMWSNLLYVSFGAYYAGRSWEKVKRD